MSGAQCNRHPVDCDCCAGTEERTPRSVANLPGRSSLAYRVGTHADFFATMLAHVSGFLGRADRDETEADDDTPMEERVARLVATALSSPYRFPVVDLEDVGEVAALAGRPPAPGKHPLSGLTTRQPNDPAIGLLDAWAVVADVLTFYQERIANEAYLPTAREDRSLRELAWLVGYRPRPGVGSQVHLAFTLDDDAVTTIKKGQSAKTVPGPAEQVETFETSADLEARGQWNRLKPLMRRVQVFPPKYNQDRTVYLKGTTTNQKKNDGLAVLFEGQEPEVWWVKGVTPDPQENVTTVKVEPWDRRPGGVLQSEKKTSALKLIEEYLAKPDLAIRLRIAKKLSETKNESDDVRRIVRNRVSQFKANNPTDSKATIDVLTEIQKWIGPTECPPFDELIRDLNNPQSSDSDKAAVDRYLEASLKGYGDPEDSTPFGVYAHLADRLSADLVEIQKHLDGTEKTEKPVKTTFEEAARTAREVQFAAKVADFRPLTRRADELARLYLDLSTKAGTSEADRGDFRKRLRGVLEAGESPNPVFVRLVEAAKSANRVLLRLLHQQLTSDLSISYNLRASREVLGAMEYIKSDNETLRKLIAELERISEAALTEAEGVLQLLLENDAVDEGTKVVKRTKTVVRDQFRGPLKYAKELGGDDLKELAKRLNRSEDAVKKLVINAVRRLAGRTALLSLRREEDVFSGGGFPRVKPWFDEVVATVERIVNFQLLKPGDEKELTTVIGGLEGKELEKFPKLKPVKDALKAPVESTLDSVGTALVELTTPPQRGPLADRFQSLSALFGLDQKPNGKASTVSQPEDAAQLFQAFHPEVEAKALQVAAKTSVERTALLPRVEALRGVAAPFGGSAPLRSVAVTGKNATTPLTVNREWPLWQVRAVVTLAVATTNEAEVSITTPEGSDIRTVKRTDDKATLIVGVNARLQSKEGTSLVLTLSPVGTTTAHRVTVNFAAVPEVRFDTDPPASAAILSPEASYGVPIPVHPGTERTIEISDGLATLVRFGAPKDTNPAATPAPDRLRIAVEYGIPVPQEKRRSLTLDAAYDRIPPGSHVVVQRAAEGPLLRSDPPQVFRVEAAESVAVAEFGISAKVTRLLLNGDWLGAGDVSLGQVRRASVLIQSEPLELVEEPYDADIQGDEVQLDGIYDGLRPGRLIIIEGERTDLPGTRGVRNAELAEVAWCEQRIEAESSPSKPAKDAPSKKDAKAALDPAYSQGPGGGPRERQPRTSARPHTTLVLKRELQYSYKRDTVVIYGNVVPATHGQTQREILGNGDAAAARQSFALKQRPLTYLPAVTVSGAKGELEVRVNDVLWHEAERLSLLEPHDRKYLVVTDDLGRTVVQFGDGEKGARLPTGVENVRAVYRTGIGRSGNAKPAQVNQLGERPLGVRDVVNPLGGTGGVDREPLHAVRRNIPAGLTALDRLVSVADYEDFARRYAGIARAKAVSRGPDVFVTVAAQDDAPLAGKDDHPLDGNPLLKTLKKALEEFGDPSVHPTVKHRRLYFIVLEATVTVHPDYLWKGVERDLRARLLSLLGFDERELDQDVLLSPAVAAMHGVPGVVAAHVKVFGLVPERHREGLALTPSEIAARIVEATKVAPRDVLELEKGEANGRAALAYLTPRVPATLILHEKKP